MRDKCRDYLDHAMGGGTGPDGALPRVLLTAPTPQRCAAIFNLISDLTTGLPPPAIDLFSVCEHATAAEHLITALHDQ